MVESLKKCGEKMEKLTDLLNDMGVILNEKDNQNIEKDIEILIQGETPLDKIVLITRKIVFNKISQRGINDVASFKSFFAIREEEDGLPNWLFDFFHMYSSISSGGYSILYKNVSFVRNVVNFKIDKNTDKKFFQKKIEGYEIKRIFSLEELKKESCEIVLKELLNITNFLLEPEIKKTFVKKLEQAIEYDLQEIKKGL